MNEFEYEVMQKKRLARNARHKKNGSRSRFVSLPSDNEKPKKEDVKVYKIGKPISWEEFKSYPNDIQKEYLRWVAEELNATTGMLSELWGIRPGSMWAYFKPRNLNGILPLGCKEKYKKRFKKWLKGDKNESATKTVEPPKEEPPKIEKVVEEPVFFDVISSCDMQLKGKAIEIGQTIYKLFRDQVISVTVKFGEEKEMVAPQAPVRFSTDSFVADDFGEDE